MHPEFLRKAEKIAIGVALAGMLFKFQHWPLASLLLILGLSTLAILYLQLATRWFGRPSQKDQVRWFTQVCGIGMAVVILGVLLTIQQWPNGDLFVLLGTLCCAVMAMLTLTRRKQRPELDEYNRQLLWRLSTIGALGALTLFGRSLKSGRDVHPDQEPITIADAVPMLRPDWAQLIADSGSIGVFVLWEPDSVRLQLSDSTRAFMGFLPASTFKVFNSLVALQEGAVADEHTIIPWDGVTRQSADWNEDQDMTQAIARSTVWWYQEVARRAGTSSMQHWLDTVGYGNAVMGDSVHLFWLQGGLRITPVEQVHFMQRLHEERLPFDQRNQRIVKRIVPGDSTATWKLQGKTGWAIRVKEEYGWYVGWVRRAGRIAYFAINLDIRNMDDVRRRKTVTYALLASEGWIDR